MNALVVDVGNSSIKAAIFKNGELFESRRFQDETHLLEWVMNKKEVDHMVIGNVGHLENIEALSDGRFPIHQAKTNWKHELKVRYETIETLGIDRLAGVVAAWHKFESASLVFDLGSCLTIDYVDDHAEYHGGNISPGWKMRVRAMNQFTANLPLVTTDIPESEMGVNTMTALQNGAFRGMLHELRGYIHERKQRNDELNVILSGGDAFQFAKYLKMEIFVLPDLILEGLYKLLHANIS